MSQRQKETSLLQYLDENPPDLANRAYLKSLGHSTSQVDFGAAHDSSSKAKVLTVPPPPRTQIISTQPDTRGWLSMVSGKDDDDAGSQKDQPSGQSLITPLLWVPGVLRQQGAWASAMKETAQGPAFATTPGVDLVDKNLLVETTHKLSLEDEIAAKDQLIQDLERSLAKQRLITERLVRDTRKHGKLFSTQFEKARDEERRRNKQVRARTIGTLEERLQDLKDNMRTLKKASSSRVRKTYDQDNFLSMYAGIKDKVREEAKAIADTEHTSLKNQLSALSRQLKRDAVYKAALKTRTEIAEHASDKRWMEAENKIPALESLIHDANSRTAHDRLLIQERTHRHRRERERLEALLHKEQELRRQAEEQCAALAKRLS